MRRFIDGGGVTHATHNGAFWTDRAQNTACGIQFVGYDPLNGSSHMFRTIGPPNKITLLRGTFEDLAVDCMSCLVGMRTWDQRWT